MAEVSTTTLRKLLDIKCPGKTKSTEENSTNGKGSPASGDGEDSNNQDDEDADLNDDAECCSNEEDSKISAPTSDTEDELQQLRHENTSLVERLARMEEEHAQRVLKLETKYQQAIATRMEIEQRLRSQLQAVQQEQEAAVEKARKVRTILTRISTWLRQLQRAAQSELLKPVKHELELRVTPHTESPYKLWVNEINLATNVSECYESPAASSKLTFDQNWPAPDSYSAQIENVSEPPPAPGRNRTKSVVGKGFNYVVYSEPSPSNRPSEDVVKPFGGPEIVLDGMPTVNSAPCKDAPPRRRSAGALLAFCAQVVSTSLAGVRSSPSPQGKVSPWKLDRLFSVREEPQIDEETGQCSPPSSSRSQSLNVALPSLSIGLL